MNCPSSAAADFSRSGLSRAGIEARVVVAVSRLIARCRAHRISIATTMIPMIRSGFTMIT